MIKSIGFFAGVRRIALRTASASSMSMYLLTAIPSRLTVSSRCIRVMTLLPRAFCNSSITAERLFSSDALPTHCESSMKINRNQKRRRTTLATMDNREVPSDIFKTPHSRKQITIGGKLPYESRNHLDGPFDYPCSRNGSVR